MPKLPNGCMCSELAVFPSNWKEEKAPMERPWYISYRFYDANNNVKQVALRGMNHLADWQARRNLTDFILDEEKERLRKGFNPITREFASDINLELSPDTSLIPALEYAYKKLKCAKHTLDCVKSMLNVATKAAKQLNIYTLAVGETKRRHIVRLLEQCSTNNNLSPSSYNHYRSYLMMMFKVLVKIEAIETNPVTKEIDKEKVVQRIRQTLTIEERREIDIYLSDNHYNFWRYTNIFFHSGSRTTELFRLQGKDVDLQKQFFTITLLKGRQKREIRKAIKDIALPFWKDVMKDCGPDDYLFGLHFQPGTKAVLAEKASKYWNKHVKAPQGKGGLGIKADFYSLKHSHSDEIASLLSLQEASRHNSHTSLDTTRIYAVNEDERMNERVKKLGNKF